MCRYRESICRINVFPLFVISTFQIVDNFYFDMLRLNTFLCIFTSDKASRKSIPMLEKNWVIR